MALYITRQTPPKLYSEFSNNITQGMSDSFAILFNVLSIFVIKLILPCITIEKSTLL